MRAPSASSNSSCRARGRILLATPASLIALLRSVSVSWQQHAQTENAREISVEQAREHEEGDLLDDRERVGDAETVTEKILYINEALGGVSRITFQMGVSTLPHSKMMHAIEILGHSVAPLVREGLSVTAK